MRLRLLPPRGCRATFFVEILLCCNRALTLSSWQGPSITGIFVLHICRSRESYAFSALDTTGGGIGFSLWVLVLAGTKPHRVKSLCENSIWARPAAEAALILHTLRHG